MANINVYVPYYTKGANGKKGFQFIKLIGTVTNARVDEGQPCISSRAMTTTPNKDRQPPETP